MKDREGSTFIPLESLEMQSNRSFYNLRSYENTWPMPSLYYLKNSLDEIARRQHEERKNNMARFRTKCTTRTPGEKVTLPTVVGGKCNAIIHWGDASSSAITAWDDTGLTHSYASAGDHIIEIMGQFDGWDDRILTGKITGDKLSSQGTLKLCDSVNYTSSTKVPQKSKKEGNDVVEYVEYFDPETFEIKRKKKNIVAEKSVSDEGERGLSPVMNELFSSKYDPRDIKKCAWNIIDEDKEYFEKKVLSSFGIPRDDDNSKSKQEGKDMGEMKEGMAYRSIDDFQYGDRVLGLNRYVVTYVKDLCINLGINGGLKYFVSLNTENVGFFTLVKRFGKQSCPNNDLLGLFVLYSDDYGGNAIEEKMVRWRGSFYEEKDRQSGLTLIHDENWKGLLATVANERGYWEQIERGYDQWQEGTYKPKSKELNNQWDPYDLSGSLKW